MPTYPRSYADVVTDPNTGNDVGDKGLETLRGITSHFAPGIEDLVMEAVRTPAGERNDIHAAAIELLEAKISEGARNARGMTEQDVASLGSYGLGAGDEANHHALAASNVLNAALGRNYADDVDSLAAGRVFSEGEPYYDRNSRLDNASKMYATSREHPRHWSSTWSSYYPQYSWIGDGGSLSNLLDKVGGVSSWGQGMSVMSQLDNARQRASRVPDDQITIPTSSGRAHVYQPLMDMAQNTAKTIWNFGRGFFDDLDHEVAKTRVNRPSPLVKGAGPGTQEADAQIERIRKFRDQTHMPAAKDYVKATTGEDISPAGNFAATMMSAPLDYSLPVTAGLYGLVKGGATKAGLNIARGVAIDEAQEASNYLFGLGSLLEDRKSDATPESYRKQYEESRKAFEGGY
jgi:hypothetical protein